MKQLIPDSLRGLGGSTKVVDIAKSRQRPLLIALEEIYGMRQPARALIDRFELNRYEEVTVLYLSHHLSEDTKVRNLQDYAKDNFPSTLYLIATSTRGWITLLIDLAGETHVDICSTLGIAVEVLVEAFHAPFEPPVALDELDKAVRDSVDKALISLYLEAS